MKKLRVLFAVTLAAMVGFVAIANKPVSEVGPSPILEKSQQIVEWQYKSDDATLVRDASLWEKSSIEHPNCGAGITLPCTLMGPEDSDEFESYLSQFPTDQAVVSAALSTRNP